MTPINNSTACPAGIWAITARILQAFGVAAILFGPWGVANNTDVAVPTAHANVFTRILREAGEAGGNTARKIADFPTSAAARLVAKLPQKPGQVALAAHVNPAGHWKFVNAAGDVFTAATPDEMSRILTVLAPDKAAANPRLVLYLSEQSVFARAEDLASLPKGASHNIVVSKQHYPLQTLTNSTGTQRVARIRENVVTALKDRRAFDETIWQLARPLNKADIRVLSLKPGGPASLAPVPRFDKTTRGAVVDAIDPDALAGALTAVRGQTVLITGEIRDGALHFIPATGSPRSLNFTQVQNAARANDVNLIVMQSRSPRQPGGTNWFWQTVEVGGLNDALKRATLADFLNALGESGAQKFDVSATLQGNGRVVLDARPLPQGTTVPYADVVGEIVGDVAAEVTGNVVMTAIKADLRDKERQQELDNRIIPGIPSIYQMFYFGSVVIGLLAWSVSREVFAMIWPPENRQEYRSSTGYNAARVVKTLVFLFVFLPVAGIPMMILMVILQILTVLGWLWAIVTAPAKLWRWMTKA